MPLTDASNVLAALYPVATNSRLTFLASDTWANILDFRLFSRNRFPASFIEGTLGFTPNIGNREPFEQCVSQLTPDSTDIPNFRAFWELAFLCRLDREDLLPCPENIRERDFAVINCRCTGGENLREIQADVQFLILIELCIEQSGICPGFRISSGRNAQTDQGKLRSFPRD
jgi:hypothetical protein